MAAASAYTQAEATNIQHAINLMVQGNAPELPFDSTCMESVAKTAASLGYTNSDQEFLQKAQNRPISTLLDFLLWLGGAPGGVVPAQT
jgi:hypothetical protein